mmetsp:Transcript_85957/g.256369  ORF Transcript_85957/g.256369 Transcript_85957/m.256369 type:complete len:210 (+) Transcript_85957:80-709(+)
MPSIDHQVLALDPCGVPVEWPRREFGLKPSKQQCHSATGFLLHSARPLPPPLSALAAPGRREPFPPPAPSSQAGGFSGLAPTAAHRLRRPRCPWPHGVASAVRASGADAASCAVGVVSGGRPPLPLPRDRGPNLPPWAARRARAALGFETEASFSSGGSVTPAQPAIRRRISPYASSSRFSSSTPIPSILSENRLFLGQTCMTVMFERT